MAKPIPKDCKRIKPHHVQKLSAHELGELFLRIELQAQELNRARRYVQEALLQNSQ